MVCRQVLGGKSKSSSRERLRKTTKCNKSFTARGMLDNFEISLEVLLPNITTAHTITYINYNFLALIRFFLMAITIYDYLPSLMLVPSVSSLIRSMGNNSKNNKIIITGDLQPITSSYDNNLLTSSLLMYLRCFDIIVFQRPYRYFSITLKVILSLSDRYKIFTND